MNSYPQSLEFQYRTLQTFSVSANLAHSKSALYRRLQQEYIFSPEIPCLNFLLHLFTAYVHVLFPSCFQVFASLASFGFSVIFSTVPLNCLNCLYSLLPLTFLPFIHPCYPCLCLFSPDLPGSFRLFSPCLLTSTTCCSLLLLGVFKSFASCKFAVCLYNQQPTKSVSHPFKALPLYFYAPLHASPPLLKALAVLILRYSLRY